MGCTICKSGAREANETYYLQYQCTLEELYTGAVKQCKIKRNRYDIHGNKLSTFVDTLQIKIFPGSRDGHIIVFPRKGDIRPNVIPGDLVVVLREQPHPVFIRNGDHLFTRKKVSLYEALAEDYLTLKTLDNRLITIPNIDFNRPEVGIQVRDEGMPFLCDRTRKGILHIRFELDFPKSLTEEQKRKLKEMLSKEIAPNTELVTIPFY